MAKLYGYENVSDVVATSQGVWAASDGGIFYYQFSDSSFTKITKADGLSGHDVTTIALDKNGNLWAGTESGIINIYISSSNEIRKILDIANSDYTSKGINDIQISGDTVYVAMDFGLSTVSLNDFSFFDTAVKLGSLPTETPVRSVSLNGAVIASTDLGIATLKKNVNNLSAPEAWNSEPINTTGAPSQIYRTLIFDGNYYAATNSGLATKKSGQWEYKEFNNSIIKDLLIYNDSLIVLRNNSVYSFKNDNIKLLDQSGRYSYNSVTYNNSQLVFGTTDGVRAGLNSLNGNTPNGPLTNLALSMTVDDDGILWVGSGKKSSGQGIFKYDNSNWEFINNTNNNTAIPNNDIYVVEYLQDKNLYFCSWGGGFTVLQDGIFKNHNTTNTELIGFDVGGYLVIAGIQKDTRDNLWVLNSQTMSLENLWVMTPDSTWYSYRHRGADILFEDEVRHLTVDQYDTKWFTTVGKGLFYFNEQNTLENESDDVYGVLKTTDGLNSNDISAIEVDKRGELWIGTSQGVNYLPNPSSPRSTIYSVFSLRAEPITCITIDPLNRKWVGTSKGVSLLSEDGSVLLAQYDTKNSALPSNTVHNIAIDGKSGQVYFGTDFGVVSFKTDAIEPYENNENLFVYPNPFIIGNGQSSNLSIEGLADDSNIKILSLSNDVVADIQTAGGGMAENIWNGKDKNNNFVPSGIYIIVAYDAKADMVGTTKVAVIRK